MFVKQNCVPAGWVWVCVLIPGKENDLGPQRGETQHGVCGAGLVEARMVSMEGRAW